MARDGFNFLLCAIALFLTPALASSGSAEEGPTRIEKLLAVNTALRQGRDHLQRGHYQAAVQVLESRLDWIDANKEYLLTLREAYFGHIRDLQKTGKEAEVQVYLRRLRALDPGALLELKVAPARSIAAQEKPPEAAPTAAPEARLPEASAPIKTAASPTPSPAPRVVRGEVEDPVEQAGRKGTQEARVLLERAEKEFESRQYDAACRFYELANRAEPNLVASESRERWAYCKLNHVVTLLNRPDPGVSPEEMEQKVREAMAMASAKLDRFGEQILSKIREQRPGASASRGSAIEAAPVAVQHLSSQAGWQVAQTTSFRIFHNQSRETAEQAARIAEATRIAMSQKWFGDDGGQWNPRCDVYLHASAQDYSRATSQSPSCPGHSTIHTSGERIISRRIDLHIDDSNMMIGVLPHETTHVVLAGRFGEKPLPRWIDEGMAVLTEPRDRVERHLQNLPKHRGDGLLFRMAALLPMTDYPEPRYIGAFYAQSVSVVDYLTARKGPRTFTEFVRDGLAQGFEPALQKHYGLQGYADLEQQWISTAFSAPGAQPVARGDR